MAHPQDGKPHHTPLHVLERRAEGMPSAREIAAAKAAARKKEKKLNVDWNDAEAVRALVKKYPSVSETPKTDEDGN